MISYCLERTFVLLLEGMFRSTLGPVQRNADREVGIFPVSFIQDQNQRARATYSLPELIRLSAASSMLADIHCERWNYGSNAEKFGKKGGEKVPRLWMQEKLTIHCEFTFCQHYKVKRLDWILLVGIGNFFQTFQIVYNYEKINFFQHVQIFYQNHTFWLNILIKFLFLHFLFYKVVIK